MGTRAVSIHLLQFFTTTNNICNAQSESSAAASLFTPPFHSQPTAHCAEHIDPILAPSLQHHGKASRVHKYTVRTICSCRQGVWVNTTRSNLHELSRLLPLSHAGCAVEIVAALTGGVPLLSPAGSTHGRTSLCLASIPHVVLLVVARTVLAIASVRSRLLVSLLVAPLLVPPLLVGVEAALLGLLVPVPAPTVGWLLLWVPSVSTAAAIAACHDCTIAHLVNILRHDLRVVAVSS